MCCGLWLAKRDEVTGGSIKIADKGMQMKTGNVEKGIAQEENANMGKALQRYSRNVTKEEERREREREKKRMQIERARGDTEREGAKERMRRKGKGEGKKGGLWLKEGWSTRMVSRRSLAVWHPSTSQTTTTTCFRQACAMLLLSNHRAPALISQRPSQDKRKSVPAVQLSDPSRSQTQTFEPPKFSGLFSEENERTRSSRESP